MSAPYKYTKEDQLRYLSSEINYLFECIQINKIKIKWSVNCSVSLNLASIFALSLQSVSHNLVANVCPSTIKHSSLYLNRQPIITVLQT